MNHFNLGRAVSVGIRLYHSDNVTQRESPGPSPQCLLCKVLSTLLSNLGIFLLWKVAVPKPGDARGSSTAAAPVSGCSSTGEGPAIAVPPKRENGHYIIGVLKLRSCLVHCTGWFVLCQIYQSALAPAAKANDRALPAH